MNQQPQLFVCYGWGSAIAEALLTQAGIGYHALKIRGKDIHNPKGALAKANPLCQIPTMILPNGEVLTESAAIAMWANEQNPQSALIPNDEKKRYALLRRLMWLVGAVYPTFTYGDYPEKYVRSQAAQKQLVNSTNARREMLWKHWEAQIANDAQIQPNLFTFGNSITAPDLFLTVMAHWRPGRAWFAQHCPHLSQVVARVLTTPNLSSVWHNNFPAK